MSLVVLLGWLLRLFCNLAVHIGNRGKESAKKLIDQVPNMKIYYTDDWDAYGCAIKDPETREIEKSVILKILNDLILE